MDDPKLFNEKKIYQTNQSLAKAVLMVLGYRGVRDFAKRADINHQTVSVALGTSKSNGMKHGVSLIRVHEALHSAYMDSRPYLQRGERAFVKEWAKRWRKWILGSVLWVESPGKLKDDTPERIRDRERRRVEVRTSAERALYALKWD